MKTLFDIPNQELIALLKCDSSRASQIKSGLVKPSHKVALAIHDRFGIPLWNIRPDIYPRRLFPKCKNKEGSQQ